MGIAWGSLGIVALVSLPTGIAVVALVAFALVGLSARTRPASNAADGAALSPMTGTAVAVLCLAATLVIVGYGLFLIVA